MTGFLNFTGTNSIIRNTVLYSMSGALYALTPLALLPLLTRTLTVKEYAYYILISSAIGLITPFIGFGAGNAVVVRYFSLASGQLSVYLSTVIWVMVLSFVAFTSAVLLLPESISGLFEPGPWFLLFSITMAFLASVALVFASLSVASANPIGYLRAYASYGVSLFVSTVFFCGVLDYGLVGACLGTCFGYFAFAVASCLGSKVENLECKWECTNAQDAIRFGSPLMIHTSAGVFVSLSDRFAVSNWVGTDAVAVYGVTAQLSLMIGYFFSSANKVIQPRIYSLLKTGGAVNQRSAISYVYVYCVAVFALSSLYALAFPFFAFWFAGAVYQIQPAVSAFIILGAAFNAMYLAFSHFIFFKEKTFILSLISFSCAVVYFCLLGFLAPRYGLIGVSLSFAMVNGLMLLLTILLARLCTDVKWFDKLLFSTWKHWSP